jgi:hypothetical protein
MSQLSDATDVVALLTHHSTDRPWILYEAGVAKGKLDTNVLGIALGVPLGRVSTGPFGQFQNCGDDEDSLTKLVIQLLQRNPDASPREEAVRIQVRVFLDVVKKLVSSKGKATAQASDESNVAKLFEEVKIMVRDLPERVDDRVRMAGRKGVGKKLRRIHPMMFEELLFRPSLKSPESGGAMAWLLFLSMLRDDVPWLYDLGQDLYRALRSKDTVLIRKESRELIAVLEATFSGPFFHEILRPDDEEMFYIVRHIPEIIERFVSKYRGEESAFDDVISRKMMKVRDGKVPT